MYGNGKIPEIVFIAYQMMFAIITPALITGAFVNRVTFKSYLIFLTFWQILVYYPFVHMHRFERKEEFILVFSYFDEVTGSHSRTQDWIILVNLYGYLKHFGIGIGQLFTNISHIGYHSSIFLFGKGIHANPNLLPRFNLADINFVYVAFGIHDQRR